MGESLVVVNLVVLSGHQHVYSFHFQWLNLRHSFCAIAFHDIDDGRYIL